MTISSRTPEGGPNRCPVCGHTFRIEPSRPLGDAPCPACAAVVRDRRRGGTLLRPGGGRPDRVGCRPTGVSPAAVRAERLDELGLDSLDVVKLLM